MHKEMKRIRRCCGHNAGYDRLSYASRNGTLSYNGFRHDFQDAGYYYSADNLKIRESCDECSC